MSHGAYRNPEAVVEQEVEMKCPHCGKSILDWTLDYKGMREMQGKFIQADLARRQLEADRARKASPLGEDYERERRKIDG